MVVQLSVQLANTAEAVEIEVLGRENRVVGLAIPSAGTDNALSRIIAIDFCMVNLSVSGVLFPVTDERWSDQDRTIWRQNHLAVEEQCNSHQGDHDPQQRSQREGFAQQRHNRQDKERAGR